MRQAAGSSWLEAGEKRVAEARGAGPSGLSRARRPPLRSLHRVNILRPLHFGYNIFQANIY